MVACLSWTSIAVLPLSFVEHILQMYVLPAVCFGLEYVPGGTQFRRFRTRLQQWGLRLPMWSRGSPGDATRSTLRLSQVACLSARLLNLPRSCFTARIAQHAAFEPSFWLCSKLRELQQLGILHPRDFGAVSGCQFRVLQPLLRTMRVVLSPHAYATHKSIFQ